MQVRFLDPAFRLATAKALTERVDAQPNRKRIPHIIQRLEKHPHLLTSEPVAPGVGDPHFEVNGWDVVFDVESGGTRITLHETPPCTCEIGQQLGHRRGYGHDTRLEHGDSCLWYWPGFSSNEYHPFETVAGTSWVDRPTGWIATLELKPDLGDDYPSVLRQVKRQPEISRYTGWGYSCGRPAVVIRRASFARVTWDDVVAVFAASGITLLQESAIESLLGQATAD